MTERTDIAAALHWLRQGDASRTIRELEALVARTPSAAAAHNALGSVLAAAGRVQEAEAALRTAIALRPDYPEAHTNLGNLLLERGELLVALGAFDRALASQRAPVQAHAGQGRALCLLGRHRAAGEAFERAAKHAGAYAAIHSQRCYASLLDPDGDAARIVAIHRDYEVAVAAPASAHREPPRDAAQPLVVGYVSADFREHSVASFLEAVLAAHDRPALHVILYADVAREDATTERLRGLVDGYQRIVGMSNEALVARVRQDRVDVLIDLAGHMQPNRLPAFASRPAPVLLTYLGYPGTTGMAVFDGRISDVWADPHDDPTLVGPEPVLRVEGGYFAYTPPSDAPPVSELPVDASGAITFGSLNDSLKLNAALLSTWAEILVQLPAARLLLKSRMLTSSDARHWILGTLVACGVSESRVDLLPATATRREHLATYGRVDLALDTFPYAGATTTCEALFMGVPVITRAGDRHAARLGVSILSAAGLAVWIADTREDYIARAVAQARDVAGLRAWRRSLRARMLASPLCDGTRVARAIECFARIAKR